MGRAYGYYWVDTSILNDVKDQSTVIVTRPTVEALQSVQAAGLKAIVVAVDYFFELALDQPTNKLRLRSDYLTQWNLVKPLLTQYQDVIYGFYPIDEPYWNAYNNATPQATMYTMLNTAASVIKTSFPSKPLAMVEAYPMIDAALQLPALFDLFGMDCYDGWDVCGGAGVGNGYVPKSIPTLYNTLKSKVQALNAVDGGHRGMVILPPTSTYKPTGGTQQLTEAQLRTIGSNYMNLAMTDPMVNMVLNFAWPTFTEGAGQWIGLRNMSTATKNYFHYFSNKYLGRPTRIQPTGAMASNSFPGAGPEYAIDGNSGTAWNAGNGATPESPQWIQLDLGSATTLVEINLVVSQSPAGPTTHEMWVGPDPSALTKVGTRSESTSDGQVIHLEDPALTSGMSDVRYIRLVTTSSPSWVSWREIEVYGIH